MHYVIALQFHRRLIIGYELKTTNVFLEGSTRGVFNKSASSCTYNRIHIFSE